MPKTSAEQQACNRNYYTIFRRFFQYIIEKYYSIKHVEKRRIFLSKIPMFFCVKSYENLLTSRNQHSKIKA